MVSEWVPGGEGNRRGVLQVGSVSGGALSKLLEPSLDVRRALTSTVGRATEGVIDRRQPAMDVGAGAEFNRREGPGSYTHQTLPTTPYV